MRSSFVIIEDCIFSGDRIIIPVVFRRRILEELHTGHPGYVRMKMIAQGKVFWPGINRDIENTVKQCEDCAKVPKAPIKCTLKSWPVPTKPWSRIHADFAGPIDGFHYLIIVDAYSNWPEAFKMTTTTSAKTIECFEEVIARHGLFDVLVTDNGPQLISKEFRDFAEKTSFEHITTAYYHPQSNGRAEKFVDLLKTGLRKAKGSADQKLREFLLAYRSTPSYALGNKSPAQLMLGRSMKSRLDLLKPGQTPASKRNTTMEERFNFAHGARWKEFSIGDDVWYKLHNVQKNSWEWTSATVVGRVGTVNYKLRLQNGREIPKAHANQLKLRYNEIKDEFELGDVDNEVPEVEPFIIPAVDNEQQQNGVEQHQEGADHDDYGLSDDDPDREQTINDESLYEDAEDVIDDEFVQPVEPEIRRSTRATKGVLPQRFRQ